MTVISVITPVWNARSFIADAAATLAAQVLPPDCTIEWSIVDDGSTDDSLDVARALVDSLGFPVSVRAMTTNAGPAAARNLALRSAAGEFVTFLDVDDLWPPDRLQLMLNRLLADGSVGWVSGMMQPSIAPGNSAFWTELGFAEPMSAPPLLATGLYRRDLFFDIGPLDETLRFGEDMDWYLRASDRGVRCESIDSVVLSYRMHESNMTRDRTAVNRSVQQVLARSIARRRKATPPAAQHSVIIPVRNGEQQLRRAVESVCREIPDDVEIVIIDDGSTDRTLDLIGELIGEGLTGHLADGKVVSIRYGRVDRGLPSAARNAGLAMTTSTFVSFIDADDEWLPSHWSILPECLADPSIDVVWGLIEPVLADVVDPSLVAAFPDERPLPSPMIGAAVYRRSVFDRVGRFDESLRFAEDTDWWLRANEAQVGMRLIEVPVLRYHLHDTNMTIDKPSMKRAHLTALAKSLRRRRAAGDSARLRQLSELTESAVSR